MRFPRGFALALLSALLSFAPLPSSASVVYRYTGPTFYDVLGGGGEVSFLGTIEVEQPLPVNTSFGNIASIPGLVSFEFVVSGTGFGLSNDTPTLQIPAFYLATDLNGEIVYWTVRLIRPFANQRDEGDYLLTMETHGSFDVGFPNDFVDRFYYSSILNGTIGIRNGGLSHTGYGSWETISEVPEPHTLALFGLGLAGLAFTRRRKH